MAFRTDLVTGPFHDSMRQVKNFMGHHPPDGRLVIEDNQKLMSAVIRNEAVAANTVKPTVIFLKLVSLFMNIVGDNQDNDSFVYRNSEFSADGFHSVNFPERSGTGVNGEGGFQFVSPYQSILCQFISWSNWANKCPLAGFRNVFFC